MTAQIQNRTSCLMGVDTQMLYRIALQNMQRVMPAQINSITQIIEDLNAFGEEPDEDRGEEDAPFLCVDNVQVSMGPPACSIQEC